MSSIIHFTEKYDTLKSILTEQSFRLKYCNEVFYLGDKVASKAVHPMVSFSEQIVKNIDRKYITYGKFGIAMNRSWVTAKKLHPVLYLDKNSTVANALTLLLKARRDKTETQLTSLVKVSIMTIKCFTKNAVGYNSYFDINDFNFKTEKEWRFVPTKSDINNNLISQTKSLYDKRPKYYNDKLKAYPLTFKRSEIDYIFVETKVQQDEISTLFKIDKNRILLSKWSTELRKRKAITSANLSKNG
nr:abortive infection system antitoxin AbiGi family protein [uncultured Pedobacter sp.]